MAALAFFRVFVDSCFYACISQCLCGRLRLLLLFSVFVSTLVLALMPLALVLALLVETKLNEAPSPYCSITLKS